MSDRPGPEKREWRFYLDDMIGFAEKVLAYTHGLDRAAFEKGGLTTDLKERPAVRYDIEVSREAASAKPGEKGKVPSASAPTETK